MKTKKQADNTVLFLEVFITWLDTCYENGEDCIHPKTGNVVSDNEYDALKRRLKELCPTSHIFDSVTASKVSAKNKILHDPPMTSIAKCNGTEEEKEEILIKWFKDCFPGKKGKFSSLPNVDGRISISYKIDGIACSIIYKDGKLVCAGTRSGSGKEGENITDKMKYVKGVPQKLNLPISCIIRGELIILISSFKRINKKLEKAEEKIYKNARALTAGSMGKKTAEEIKDRGIHFKAYNILNLKNPPYTTETERAIWANKSLGITFVRTEKFSIKKLKKMEEEYKTLDYMVDGVVFSLNNLKSQLALGHSGNKSTGDPRGKIAFKFKDETAKTVVKGIEWNCGRTGSITPVLIIKPVELEGTTVSKCTAHNIGRLAELGIDVGTTLEIIKSGKIIPKIHKVIKPTAEEYQEKGDKSSYPQTCPSCGGGTTIDHNKEKNTTRLYCGNINCPGQRTKKFNHFLSVLGVKGVAESTIDKLVETGLLKEFADFYKLTPEILMSKGFTERTALLIVARINMLHEPEQIKDNAVLRKKIEDAICELLVVPMDRFFAALGIKEAGKEIGRLLSINYNSFDTIRNLKKEELKNIDGIGPISANNIYNYFKNNREEIEDVIDYFKFEVPKSSGKLKGKTFVLSGKLESGKSFWENKIKEQGGIVKGSVSKGITYLLAGSGSGAKSEKARQLGINILNVEDLEKIL